MPATCFISFIFRFYNPRHVLWSVIIIIVIIVVIIIDAIKSMGKLSRTYHAGAEGKRCSSYSFLTSALDGVSGQCHTLGNDPGTHWTGGWVGIRAGVDTEVRERSLCLCRGSKPAVQSDTKDWATPAPINIPNRFINTCHCHSCLQHHLSFIDSLFSHSGEAKQSEAMLWGARTVVRKPQSG
jgi:hypothetical protein